MPHIHIDYSPNLEARLDIPGFCKAVHKAVMETGLFPLAGVRIRAIACDHVLIADGDPQHAYLDMSLRLRGGRDLEDRKRATAHIFAAAEAFCTELMASSSFNLSMEMRDIDPELAPKKNSTRDYLKD